jgi:hypothetical protein
LVAVFILAGSNPLFAQQATQSGPSHKYRTILTIAGAGGGFVLGVFLGIMKFDDAINSERKVTTTAVLTAGGGAVGGYFIGRALDGRRNRVSLAPGQFDLRPVLSGDAKGFQFSVGF